MLISLAAKYAYILQPLHKARNNYFSSTKIPISMLSTRNKRSRSRLSQYFKTYKKPRSSLYETPMIELPTPLPSEDDDLLQKLWVEYLEINSPYIVELPSTDFSLRLATASTLSTVNEGTPFLLSERKREEPFPAVPKRDAKKIVKAACPEMERIRSLFEPEEQALHRHRGFRTRFRSLRFYIKEALLGPTRTKELVQSSENVEASHYDAFWLLDNSSDDESCIGIPLHLRNAALEAQDRLESSSAVRSNFPVSRVGCVPSKKALPGLNVSKQPILNHPLDFATLHQKWNPETSRALCQLVLANLFDTVFQGLLESLNGDLLACIFLTRNRNAPKHVFRAFEKAVTVALRMCSAIDEWETLFWKNKSGGISQAIFKRAFPVSLLEEKHCWKWELAPYHKHSHIKVVLTSEGHLRCLIRRYYPHNVLNKQLILYNSPNEKLKGGNTKDGQYWAQQMCTIADKILAMAENLFGGDEERLKREADENRRFEYL